MFLLLVTCWWRVCEMSFGMVLKLEQLLVAILYLALEQPARTLFAYSDALARQCMSSLEYPLNA